MLQGQSKPHGKHHALLKPSHAAKEKDVAPKEANEGLVLPTLVTFEASSQGHEDEDMSAEDNAKANVNVNREEDGLVKVTKRGEKSLAVLLSEEELVDLLKEESDEEETEEEEGDEETEVADKEELDPKEDTEIIEDEGDQEQGAEDNFEKEEDYKEVSDALDVKEEGEEEAGTQKQEDEVEEGTSLKGKEKETIGDIDRRVRQEMEETEGSAESEIPVDLDYAADSDISQPLQSDSAQVQPHNDHISKQKDLDAEEKEKQAGEKRMLTDKYEQNIRNTDKPVSDEQADRDKLSEMKNAKDKSSLSESHQTDRHEEPAVLQEPKSIADGNAEFEGAQLAERGDSEEEENKNDSAVHTRGKIWKQKKNKMPRTQSQHTDETSLRQEQSQQTSQESEEHTTDNTVHKAKRRRAGKWTPSVGMNPVQIRATVDLYPSARPPLGGGIHDPEASVDPCDNFRCKRGKSCKLDADSKPACVCQEPSECPASVNDFDHVCGTDNNTYDTSCELFATKCKLEGTKRGHRLHLDYTGPCKLIPPCLDTELVQFPLRMRDWLKNVLLQLYEHDTMSPGFLTPKQRVRAKKIYESERRLHAGDHPIELLAQDFEKNYNMYIYPVHWQFAQMDQHPSDRFLTHSELAPLRVPLVPMEHCTSLFFQECDADKDKLVSFTEWIHCFGIMDEDMDVNLLF
ncbi:SPARC-like protein 1 [Lampris incognitus]|uniref:SPARC-like protein 1 n=1 Tax=Lampris incognitus TaxID=2546036 RepID=UPI0024B5A482|nr:SPARC-like protein 1 [Lampris incognitus]